MKKVSIIVPVYNASKFIDKCVNSVLEQEYQDIELLLINDGSKDNSLEIIRQYEQKYPKIVKVLTHDNMGAGKTRNVGIKNATGDYIAFLDADDYLDKDYVSKLVEKLDDADLIISGYRRVNEKEEMLYEKKPIEDNEWSFLKYICVAGRIYKKSFIVKNNIEYGFYPIGEDVFFGLSAYACANKMKVLHYAGYNALLNTQSATKTMSKDSHKSDMLRVLKDVHNKLNLSKFSIDNVLFFYLKTLVLHLITLKDILTLEELTKEFNDCFLWLKQVFAENNRKIKMTKKYGEEKIVILAVNTFVLAYKMHLSKFFLRVLKKKKIDLK